MILKCTAKPEIEPVTLDDVQRQCRIGDLSAEEAEVNLFISAVRERAESITRRVFITSKWRWTFARFPVGSDGFAVPLPPLQSVDSISYVDVDGVVQTLDPSLYTVSNDAEPAVIFPLRGTSWPAVDPSPVSVTVEFTAGYGDAPGDVPARVKQWILLNVSNLYENRESETAAPGKLTMVDLKTMADGLLDDVRVIGW